MANWVPVEPTNANACAAFIAIMKQMDYGYSGLTPEMLREWLYNGDHYAYRYLDAIGDVALLARLRPGKCPDIVMLGWIPAQPNNEPAVAQVVLSIRDTLLADIGNGSVRCIVPKHMGYPPIRRLHVALYDELSGEAPTIAQLVREFDLGDSNVWYITPVAVRSIAASHRVRAHKSTQSNPLIQKDN